MATATHPKFFVAPYPSKEDDDDAAAAQAAQSAESSSQQSSPCNMVKKNGSLQVYCPHDCSAEDVGHSKFPVADVHAIGILDVRLVNQDRHPGNILVRFDKTHQSPACSSSLYSLSPPSFHRRDSEPIRVPPPIAPPLWDQRRGRSFSEPMVYVTEKLSLIPIDHGCCLPKYDHMDETSFVWLNWDQARVPFSDSDVKLISQMNSFQDMEKVDSSLSQQLGEDAFLSFHIGTCLLQVAVQHGLTLHHIGSIMCRECLDQPSILEQLVEETQNHMKNQPEWTHEEFVNEFMLRISTYLVRSSS